MAEFAVTVVDRPDIRCAGMKVRTSMQNASADCTALWRDSFGPRMEAFPADSALAGQSYGASVMVDSDAFDYWALMPLASGAEVPAGMDVFTLPGGLYAHASLAGLSELGAAFTYIYGPWIAAAEKYGLNMQGVCYEFYTCDFTVRGRLEIYCPLLEK